jgi:hypothetical protein
VSTLLDPAHQGQQLAGLGAGLIILLLIGAVVYYSAREQSTKRLGLKDARLLARLDLDLRAGEATVETLTVDAKDARRPGKLVDPDAPPPRQYFFKAGDREFQITGMRWMALAVGQAVTVDYASQSGLVLMLDGQIERLAAPGAPTREAPALERLEEE